MINYDEIDDGELGYLISENDENVKDIIYKKYYYIIDIIVKKYSNIIIKFKIDEFELRQEASYGIGDAINNFCLNTGATLITFLTVCVDRRVRKYLATVTSNKFLTFRNALSLDKSIDNLNISLKDFIEGDKKYNPLNDLTANETVGEIFKVAKNTLSSFEYEVFCFLTDEKDYKYIAQKTGKTLKQIDNTIQRIKNKFHKKVDI